MSGRLPTPSSLLEVLGRTSDGLRYEPLLESASSRMRILNKRVKWPKKERVRRH